MDEKSGSCYNYEAGAGVKDDNVKIIWLSSGLL